MRQQKVRSCLGSPPPPLPWAWAQGPGQWHRTLQVRDTFWEGDFAAFVLELHFLISWGLVRPQPGVLAVSEREWQEGWVGAGRVGLCPHLPRVSCTSCQLPFLTPPFSL